MRKISPKPARTRISFPRLRTLTRDRSHARAERFNDPSSAEDDYFRLANRNR